MNIISALSSAFQTIPVPQLPAADAAGSATGGFGEAFMAAVQQVEGDRQTAQAAATALLAGGRDDIHNVALSSQRAELSMELFQQVRNKFVQAYQEIMKMPM
jgi:flagellar hook-basal body complex protein FliE